MDIEIVCSECREILQLSPEPYQNDGIDRWSTGPHICEADQRKESIVKLKRKTRIKGSKGMIIEFFWNSFDMGFKMAHNSKMPLNVLHVISDEKLKKERLQLIDEFMEDMVK